MARILAVSSQVAFGNVGLSIIMPALQALGHEVIALPTVVLSNHPGHAHVAGEQTQPHVLHAMLDALDANGWLAGVDAVLTGYLPSVAHVAFAATAVDRVRGQSTARVPYLCDPVFGDDPKGLYLDATVAAAIFADLIPRCTHATPNRFELSTLASLASGHAVDVREVAQVSAHAMAGCVTFATSVPSDRPGEIMNVVSHKGRCAIARVTLRPHGPHGTGDLFSAMVLAAVLDGASDVEALALATSGVDQTLAASAGRTELSLADLPTRAMPTPPWPTT
jgi:pyridoxine kinase